MLKYHQLLQAHTALKELTGTCRVLTPEQKQKLGERTERLMFLVSQSFWQGKTDKEVLAEAVREKYESLT